MPRRIDDFKQPGLAPSAGDLGREAYEANKADQPGQDHTHLGDQAGLVSAWEAPEAENAPPGQRRKDAQEVKMGEDPKPEHGKEGGR